MFEDIDLRESHAELHKKPSETLGADSIYLISNDCTRHSGKVSICDT